MKTFAIVNQNEQQMYSTKDFERFYIRYKAEGLPQGESMQRFCDRNKVPFNLFNKWYTDTRHRLVKVNVTGAPTEQANAHLPGVQEHNPQADDEKLLRIMVDIRMTKGLHITHKNINYRQLRMMVEKLEGNGNPGTSRVYARGSICRPIF